MNRQPLVDYGLSEDVLCNWLIMGSQVALIDFKIAAFRRSSISKSTNLHRRRSALCFITFAHYSLAFRSPRCA